MIGIRLADGSYYSILNESEQEAKRLLLSPANNNQKLVHIPFYQADNEEFAQPRFIGKIELDNPSPDSGDESEQNISLIVESGHGNSLKIQAKDEGGGAGREFVLSIHGAETESTDSDFQIEDAAPISEDIAAFDYLDDLDLPDSTIDMPEEKPEGSLIQDDSPVQPEKQDARQPLNPALIAVLSILATVIVIALSFLFFRFSQGEPVQFMEASRPFKLALSFLLN